MENRTIYDSFLEQVDKLGTGNRVALKRSAGVMLFEADGNAISAFYRCITPMVPQWQEDRWFAVACIKCMWNPAEGAGTPVENVMAKMLRSEELSGSMEHRIKGLLDTPWDQDGYMLTKLCRLMKMLHQKTSEQLDFAGLLEDLIYWNSENQSVQRKWARAIFSTTEI